MNYKRLLANCNLIVALILIVVTMIVYILNDVSLDTKIIMGLIVSIWNFYLFENYVRDNKRK